MLNIWLAVLLWISQVADVWSTNKALTLYMLGEGNPVAQFFMDRWGSWWWLFKLPIVLLLTLVAWVNPADLAVSVALAIVTGAHLVVAWRNWRLHQTYYHPDSPAKK